MQRSHQPGLIHITGITVGRLHSIRDGAGDMIRLRGDLLHGVSDGIPGGVRDGEATGIRDGVTAGIRAEVAEDGTRVEDGIRVAVITTMEAITILPINIQTEEDQQILMPEAELQVAHMTDLTAIQEADLQVTMAQADLHQVQEAAAIV